MIHVTAKNRDQLRNPTLGSRVWATFLFYVTSELGQLSLAPSVKSRTSFAGGKGGNVTSAGWQVTLCDPIWHVTSRTGEVMC